MKKKLVSMILCVAMVATSFSILTMTIVVPISA